MKHPTYRNLTSRDTLFGLDLYDLAIVGCVANVIFRFNRTDLWLGKLLNVAVIVLVYLGLVLVKRRYPKGYIKNMINFLFKKRRFVAHGDTLLEPLKQVIHEEK